MGAVYIMHVALIVTAAATVAMALAATPIVHQGLVDAINRGNHTWTASTRQGTTVSGADEAAIKRLLGLRPPTPAEDAAIPWRTIANESFSAPDSFDAAAHWPHCTTINHIRDQSDCGSCWAVAAAEAISDRMCTYKLHSSLLISAAQIMECVCVFNYCYGCHGGSAHSAWEYWISNGLVSDQCQPYPFPKCEHYAVQHPHYPKCDHNDVAPKCPGNTCTASGQADTVYKGKSVWRLKGVHAFQKELMTNGPFEVGFKVYADFVTYKGGVYTKTSNHYLGAHAVKVVGWGSLGGVPYWKVANSWNPDWGLDGFFYIKRGVNECGIEDQGLAGEPAST